jgi:hypothetical protein
LEIRVIFFRYIRRKFIYLFCCLQPAGRPAGETLI